MIDIEIASEAHYQPQICLIKLENEMSWAKILIQGLAACETSPFELTLMRLARLKLQKPTQYMDEHAVAVFLEDICVHLQSRAYCYHAIDKGIMRLIECEDDKFFPTMKILLKYIHPIHWRLKKRIVKIEEILKRNHNKDKQVPVIINKSINDKNKAGEN